MADVGDWIRAKLVAHAGTQALVSGRVYPVRAPQTPTYPLVVYSGVGGGEFHNMGEDAGVAEIEVQLTMWAATYEGVRSLSNQVELALVRQRGLLAGVTVQDVFAEEPFDDYSDGSQKYLRHQDYTFFVEGT